jgi:1,4-dihydroxy-2-naphthoate polyprenyltransferase
VATPKQWISGARPRTLPAAISPVLVGTGAASEAHSVVLWKALLALGVSLALQVGVNYANDYSDGVRGTDAVRVGPFRLVGSGAASPSRVRMAAALAFAGAGALGVVLAATTSWWLILVGAAAIAAAWFYTGGPRPYGYSGWGEVFVFLFFGPVAVCGTTFVQVGRVTALSVAAAVAVGFLACALLVVNNLRDIPTDTLSGKRTLAVRLGDRGTRRFYVALVCAAFVVSAAVAVATRQTRWAAITLLVIPLTVVPIRSVNRGVTGPGLISVLQETGRLQLCFAVAFTIGLLLH